MTDSTPVDVEALIARLNDKALQHAHYGTDDDPLEAHAADALRALAAELDKERLAGKNTANMMLDMATENKSLRAELAALRTQEPVAEVMRNDWGDTNDEINKFLPPGTKLYASPVVQPAAANAVPDLSSEPLRSIALVRMQRVYEESKRVTVYTLADMLDAALSAQQETPR